MKSQGNVRGRPRDCTVDVKIMETTLRLVRRHGVRAVGMEMIAEASGVARTTLYRRWKNRAAVMADAFLLRLQPQIGFPAHPSPIERLRLQMRLLARAFRTSEGDMLRALLAEAQFDPELRRALRDRWIAPRRAVARVVVNEAIQAGQIPASTSPDALLDALYGGLYYWLFIEPSRLTETYADSVFETVLQRRAES